MTDYTLRVLITAKDRETARQLATELGDYSADDAKIVDVYVEEGWDD